MKLSIKIARLVWVRLPEWMRNVLTHEHLKAQNWRIVEQEPKAKFAGAPAWFALYPYREMTVVLVGEENGDVNLAAQDVLQLSAKPGKIIDLRIYTPLRN